MASKECRQCQIECTPQLHETIQRLRERNKKRLAVVLEPLDMSAKKPAVRPIVVQVKVIPVPAPPRPVYRPRVVVKHKTKGHGWNRMAEVTVETIIKLQQRGHQIEQIAPMFECTPGLIYKRLREAKKDPAFAVFYASMKICACGDKKLADRPTCTRCRWSKGRREKAAEGLISCKP